jgi:hypothetical protein
MARAEAPQKCQKPQMSSFLWVKRKLVARAARALLTFLREAAAAMVLVPGVGRAPWRVTVRAEFTANPTALPWRFRPVDHRKESQPGRPVMIFTWDTLMGFVMCGLIAAVYTLLLLDAYDFQRSGRLKLVWGNALFIAFIWLCCHANY